MTDSNIKFTSDRFVCSLQYKNDTKLYYNNKQTSKRATAAFLQNIIAS